MLLVFIVWGQVPHFPLVDRHHVSPRSNAATTRLTVEEDPPKASANRGDLTPALEAC